VSNDTQLVAPIVFAANAPAGKYLVRFYTDMQNEIAVSGNGVHITGDFQGWDPAAAQMFSFDGDVYEYIAYMDTGMAALAHDYRFINGNTVADYETVPAACANANGNRSTNVSADVMLSTVCYAACVACSGVGINENVSSSQIEIYPNPATDQFVISFKDELASHNVMITDMAGRIVLSENNYAGSTLTTGTASMTTGIYFVHVEAAGGGSSRVQKLLIR
jgi:hypothetical protein